MRVLEQAYAEGDDVLLSPISAWEIGLAAEKGRLVMPMETGRWLDRAMAGGGVCYAPLTPEILLKSSAMPPGLPNDPADRIIAATAREMGYRLVTRDSALLRYAETGYLMAVGC